ncbi:unnamed protein product [Clonostachys byssicola]|uniref:GST C-terminal domain-containing protein n=1 Tax=Clonostachys byssicola TaxID=160290 RepID=A0A9N9Y747_9HYPO|nr:unnamed protein product [Clonostachys byssicola]
MAQDLIPTLHYLHHSGALRVLWALEELKASNGTTFHLKTYPRARGQSPEELKKVFPLGQSPILVLEWADKRDESLPVFQLKPGVLTEARLILGFLSDAYGDGIWEPESKEDQRRDMYFQGFATMTLSPGVDKIVTFETLLMVLPFGLSGLMRLVIGPMVNFFKTKLSDFFDLLEASLTDEKPWFSGAKLGLADFNMSFGIDTASQRGYIDPKKYPKLTEWASKIQSREAYITAVKESGGYDLKRFGLK